MRLERLYGLTRWQIMSDLIERDRLIRNLTTISGVTQKEKPQFIWESVFRQIKEMPTAEQNDCGECLMSFPRRKWYKVTEKMPMIRQKVLVKTEKDNFYVAYYASKCWWVEDRELGDISYFFKDEKIIKWKEID